MITVLSQLAPAGATPEQVHNYHIAQRTAWQAVQDGSKPGSAVHAQATTRLAMLDKCIANPGQQYTPLQAYLPNCQGGKETAEWVDWMTTEKARQRALLAGTKPGTTLHIQAAATIHAITREQKAYADEWERAKALAAKERARARAVQDRGQKGAAADE